MTTHGNWTNITTVFRDLFPQRAAWLSERPNVRDAWKQLFIRFNLTESQVVESLQYIFNHNAAWPDDWDRMPHLIVSIARELEHYKRKVEPENFPAPHYCELCSNSGIVSCYAHEDVERVAAGDRPIHAPIGAACKCSCGDRFANKAFRRGKMKRYDSNEFCFIGQDAAAFLSARQTDVPF